MIFALYCQSLVSTAEIRKSHNHSSIYKYDVSLQSPFIITQNCFLSEGSNTCIDNVKCLGWLVSAEMEGAAKYCEPGQC